MALHNTESMLEAHIVWSVDPVGELRKVRVSERAHRVAKRGSDGMEILRWHFVQLGWVGHVRKRIRCIERHRLVEIPAVSVCCRT